MSGRKYNDLHETAKYHSQLWLTAACLYFLLATTTIHLASNGRDIATIWPANAVLLALLLLHERSAWIGILVAGFIANGLANLVTRGTIIGPLLYGVCNMLEVLVAGLSFGGQKSYTPMLGSASMVGRFVLSCGFLAPGLSALFGAMTAFFFFDQPFLSAFQTWLASDALGLLIFTPAFVAIFNGDILRYITEKGWIKRAEMLGLLAVTGVSAYLVFFMARAPLLFILFAPVMLITFRVGHLGTKMAVMLVAIIGGCATLQNLGPIANFTQDHIRQAELFQLFLAVLLLTCLPVAADLSARNRFTADLAKREKAMSLLAATDSLTGLMSRSAFEAHVDHALSDRAASFAMVAIDLDHFKDINDQWGHEAGDRALVHAARIFQTQIRAGDAAGRLGGDEFLLFLKDASIVEAEAICERIRATLRHGTMRMDDKTEIMLTLSCGIAGSAGGDTFQDLYRHADKAMYMAKFAGRNTVRSIA